MARVTTAPSQSVELLLEGPVSAVVATGERILEFNPLVRGNEIGDWRSV